MRGSSSESSLDFRAQQSVSVDDRRRSFGAAGGPDSLGLGPSVRGKPRIPRRKAVKTSTPASRAEARKVRPGGKLAMLLDAVARPEGATLDELTATSGWLPHTTRAAITRLRQRGFNVRLTSMGTRKAYHPIPAG